MPFSWFCAAAVDGNPATNYAQVKEAMLGPVGTTVQVAFLIFNIFVAQS